MQTKILSNPELLAFVGALCAEQRVFGPVCRDAGYVVAEIADPADLCFPPSGIPRESVKSALLPRSEPLFYYKIGKNTEKTVPPPPPQAQVLFGVHPCDVQAIKVLDTVFGAEPFPDELYLARRRVTTVVGRGVPAADSTAPGFFEKLGISAMDNRDCDLFLVPLGDAGYAVEVLTAKGEALSACLPACEPAGPEALEQVAELRAAAAARVTHDLDPAVLQRKLETMFDAPLWAELAEGCVGCGACAYLCPTCHCFDIQDEKRGSFGCRVRNWDTCQFELFTKHASGHNPRTAQAGRMRQRIMHKFEYGYANFGIPFCIGCGRCLLVCPVNNNLLEVLDRIQDDER